MKFVGCSTSSSSPHTAFSSMNEALMVGRGARQLAWFARHADLEAAAADIVPLVSFVVVDSERRLQKQQ